MSLHPVLLTLLGLVLLMVGGEALVRGAARLARALRVPRLVVGLTVVAVATSAPEAAVSVQAALVGNPGVALGNVLGSNAFNILFILGLSALVTPLVVRRQLVRLDVPVMMGASLLALLMALDGKVGMIEGAVLLGAGAAYTAYLGFLGHRKAAAAPPPPPSAPEEVPLGARHRLVDLLMVLVGLAALVGGADALVEGASAIARALGASDLVIGITLVAAGTSLPEVATSLVAALRGERDLAVGNLVGSNIYNILLVLGLAGMAAPQGVPIPKGVLTYDLPVMLAAAVFCFPIFLTGMRVARWEGALLLLYYGLYLTPILVNAAGHDTHDLFGPAVLRGVIPLTVLSAVVIWYCDWRRCRVRELFQDQGPPPRS